MGLRTYTYFYRSRRVYAECCYAATIQYSGVCMFKENEEKVKSAAAAAPKDNDWLAAVKAEQRSNWDADWMEGRRIQRKVFIACAVRRRDAQIHM